MGFCFAASCALPPLSCAGKPVAHSPGSLVLRNGVAGPCFCPFGLFCGASPQARLPRLWHVVRPRCRRPPISPFRFCGAAGCPYYSQFLRGAIMGLPPIAPLAVVRSSTFGSALNFFKWSQQVCLIFALVLWSSLRPSAFWSFWGAALGFVLSTPFCVFTRHPFPASGLFVRAGVGFAAAATSQGRSVFWAFAGAVP